jgi:hypothetical protein
LENVIVPSERNCPFTEDGMLLNTFRLIYPQVKSKRIISGVEEFFCKLVISAKAGIQILFCERDWMPSPIFTGVGSGAGMTGKLPDTSII